MADPSPFARDLLFSLPPVSGFLRQRKNQILIIEERQTRAVAVPEFVRREGRCEKKCLGLGKTTQSSRASSK